MHAGQLARDGEVDRPEVAARDRAAMEGDVQHAGQADIVDVDAAAGQQARVFLARRTRFADITPGAGAVGCVGRVHGAARRASARRGGCPGNRCSGRYDRDMRLHQGLAAGLAAGAAVSAASVMTMPGVQKPHCRPYSSRSACCTGCERAVVGCEAFDGGDAAAIGLHRQASGRSARPCRRRSPCRRRRRRARSRHARRYSRHRHAGSRRASGGLRRRRSARTAIDVEIDLVLAHAA